VNPQKPVLSAALVGAMLFASACAGILGLRPRVARPTFEHRAHVVEGIQCVRCHESIETTGDDEPVAFPKTSTCVDCHKKPHDDRECGMCHGAASTREAASLARRHLRFSHQNHLGREGGDCVRCHLDIKEEGHTLRPTMATCLGCHAHEEQWATRSCDPCHVDLPREAVRPEDHLMHDPGFVKTHALPAATDSQMCAACHSQRFCLGCHGGSSVPALPERLAFDKPAMGGGIHRAGFASRHAEEARGEPGLCVRCHSPSSCGQCHEKMAVGATGRIGERKSPHPPGWLGLPGQPNDHGRASWRDPALCASCHGGAGEVLCVNCHKVGAPGGNPHAPGFSSRLDKRVDRPCVLCHGGLP
jgi:hypothetical protein